jgi:hypothetical protein
MNKPQNVKLISTSDLTGEIYLLRTMFVCYAFDLLTQVSERLSCKNCIVFHFREQNTFCIRLFYAITKYGGGGVKNDCAYGLNPAPVTHIRENNCADCLKAITLEKHKYVYLLTAHNRHLQLGYLCRYIMTREI